MKTVSLPFIGLCAYVGSQAITVPILPLGNWAVWPTLPDFAWLLYVLFSLPSLTVHRSRGGQTFRLLVVGFSGAIASYAVFTVLWPILRDPITDKGSVVGLYQIYRLLQFLVVFWLTTKVPLDSTRIFVLHRTATVTCVVLCLTCIATYWFVPTSFFGGHLMSVVSEAGPWAPYIRGVSNLGVGASNINHAYTGLQIILLTALTAHTRRPSQLRPWLGALALFTVFISEHRTGLIFLTIYAVLLIRPSARYALSATIVVAVAAVIVTLSWSGAREGLLDATERHSTIATSYSTDGLSSRDQIWSDRLTFLNENPVRWIAGSGFGSSVESGQNAHMLYLHIVVETGLVGLTIFLVSFGHILGVLWRRERAPRALFWVTVCLLGTGLTQETFYPVAAFGHFIGLYMCCLGISIRSSRDLLREPDELILRSPAGGSYGRNEEFA